MPHDRAGSYGLKLADEYSRCAVVFAGNIEFQGDGDYSERHENTSSSHCPAAGRDALTAQIT
ncbi:hypothetical protein ACJ2_16510 [Pantoea sp. QMID2]|nr:hypothetical protein ACJ3_24510 [Pantoea sp. QMID3]GME40392.1 hypothetical protein ACJ1_25170 [Pantoea sp. QMID1]GME55519.1 hypothetical protein ACJ2_16510 [Pantoea sp. QMID2]